MLGRSILQTQINRSALKGQSTLKPQGRKGKRSLMATLTLTSLIDAFSILVIYLLVNFSTPTADLRVAKDLEIPAAAQSVTLAPGTVISVSQGHYFINDKEVGAEELASKLVELHARLKKDIPEKDDLVIQADKRVDYAALSPVILAGSQAGFHQFKFAVLQGGEKQ